MNILSRDKQIEIIAALCEGLGIRAVERLTGVHRDTVMRLGAQVGRGCAALHDRMMVGLRVNRLELDELWALRRQEAKARHTERIAARRAINTLSSRLAASTKAIIAYRTGKRDSGNTHDFIADLRERVLGSPEISTDGSIRIRTRSATRSAIASRTA